MAAASCLLHAVLLRKVGHSTELSLRRMIEHAGSIRGELTHPLVKSCGNLVGITSTAKHHSDFLLDLLEPLAICSWASISPHHVVHIRGNSQLHVVANINLRTARVVRRKVLVVIHHTVVYHAKGADKAPL